MARGDLAGHAWATQPKLGQRILTGEDICFPQTPHLAQAKVPDQSFYAGKPLFEAGMSCTMTLSA